MASNALECDICCNAFSKKIVPRVPRYSHTFCSSCINRIIAGQSKLCPSCREELTATSADDLVICRIVLDVVKQLSATNLKPKTLSGGPKRSFLGSSKEFEEKSNKDSIDEFFEAETKCLEEMKDVLADIESLSKKRKIFFDTNKVIEGFMEEPQEIKLSNENHLDIIDQNIKWLKKRMILLLQEEGKTQDADAKLETATEFTSIRPVMDETEEVLEEGQEKVKRIKELLQEKERNKDDITKEILKIRTRLGNVIEEKQKSFEVETPVMSAMKEIGGKQMVAPVRVKPGNQVRLSHFAEGDVPPKFLLIKHEALMKTSSRRAFLDLAVGGTFLSRIIIKIVDESNLALNFLHMCAGDLGPSYANSQLSDVGDKGQAGENIDVSTYCKSVIEVDWKKEEQREIYKSTSVKAGEVRGFFSDEDASEFYIVTRDDPSWTDKSCFGIVEEGLDVLRDAISQYPDISDVRIVDCGLMFPL